MSARSAILVVAVAMMICTGASAQDRLGDLVSQGGYDWIIGRWVATGDEGMVETEFKWGLDRGIVLASLKMGEYRHSGMIMLTPGMGEIVETAADNMGGIWKGVWTEENGSPVCRVEYTMANGQVHKGDVVYARGDNDTMTVAMYAIDSNGSRDEEPRNKLTYKRQPAATAVEAAAGSGRDAEYQKLGDLVSQGGYEWLAGKWVCDDGDQPYLLEHNWMLDKHAVLVDLKMGGFAYYGMIMYVPARQEIFQIGADNMGGFWKGIWEQGGEGATHKVEYTGSDGTMQKMEHVYLRSNNDAFQVKEYGVSNGVQTPEARRTLTFKRQKTPVEGK